MKDLLILGAGRSASALIDFFCKHRDQFTMTVADANGVLAAEKVKDCPHAESVELDIEESNLLQDLISRHRVVISMLPPHLHSIVGRMCLNHDSHLITASYVDEEMEELSTAAGKKGLIFMGELGLDPGIDHMSAMECIDQLRSKGAELIAFKSFTGGLIAPESDDNPWHYKITWNPRNVVRAGSSGATYVRHGKVRRIPYYKLFERSEMVEIHGLGPCEMYANRDSVSYRHIYGLDDIPTLVRGTLRYPGFCEGWNALIQLGLTEDKNEIDIDAVSTLKEWIASYLPAHDSEPIESRVARYLKVIPGDPVMKQLSFLGLFSNEEFPDACRTSADILEWILKSKLKMKSDDVDLIAMQHEFRYELDENIEELHSTLVIEGGKNGHSAMSQTVGLPLALFAELILDGKIQQISSPRPVQSEVYQPVLKGLKKHGINFHHRTFPIDERSKEVLF